MSDDVEKLVVMLEARIKDFEKNLAKASGTSRREYGKMRKDSKSATDAMEADAIKSTKRINEAFAGIGGKIGDLGKAKIGGLLASIAAIGVAGAVKATFELARGVAEVGDQAKIAGVNVEAFQELKFVAEQNRIGVDALTDGLKELNLRADEFIQTGGGSSAEAFQRLGYTAEELATKLKDPSALFAEIIGRLQQLDKAAQIRIADEIFGGSGGEKFVQLIDQGAAGIRRTIAEGRNLGVVMDAELIAKAEELDRKFNAVANTVGTVLKTAIVLAADALTDFIDSFRNFQNQANATLTNRQTEIMGQKNAIAARLAEIDAADSKLNDRMKARARGQLQLQMDALNTEENQIIDQLQARSQFNPVNRPAGSTVTTPAVPKDQSAEFMKAYRDELTLTNRERSVAAEAERIMADASAKGAKLTKEQANALAEETVKRNESESATKSKTTASTAAAKTTETEKQAVKDLIASMEFELSLIGRSIVEQEKLRAVRNAGAAATDEQKRRIEELAQSTHDATAAQTKLSESLQATADVSKDVLGGVIRDLRDGASTAEILDNVFTKISDRLIDMAVNNLVDSALGIGTQQSGGGLVGILGKLLGFGIGAATGGAGGAGIGGAGFATGGYTGDGAKNQPAGTVHKGEYVFDQAATKRIGVGTLARMHNGGQVGGAVPKIDIRVSMPARSPVTEAAPQMAARRAGGDQSGGKVQVNITNNSKADMQVEEKATSNGGRSFDAVFNDKVASAVSSGETKRTLQRNYGLKQNLSKL